MVNDPQLESRCKLLLLHRFSCVVLSMLDAILLIAWFLKASQCKKVQILEEGNFEPQAIIF